MTSIHVVVRLVHFIGGNVASMPISFHASEKEALAAKDIEVERLRRKFAVNGNKDLLSQIGIAGIAFEVGSFETAQADLVQVPRLIMPPS